MINVTNIIPLEKDECYYNSQTFSYRYGESELISLPYIIDNTNSRLHITTDGESLWSISYKYFENKRYWKLIADANVILDPFEVLPPTLLIPDLSNIDDNG